MFDVNRYKMTVKDSETEQNEGNIVEINENLQFTKENTWIGKSLEDTENFDYMIKNLKELIDGDELEGIDKVRAIKELKDIEKEKTSRLIHLDNVMLKASMINRLAPSEQRNIEEVLR